MKKNRALDFIVLPILAVWLVLYLAAIRPAFLRWGATDEEAVRVFPADERIPVSGYQCTRALTIDAPPEKVWPWFAQLGVGRAGFYSYSWLENLLLSSIHNTYRLIPDWQRRESGDFVRSFQFGTDNPGINGWRFEILEPGLIFYLSPGWGPFVLEPRGDSQTRLLVRSRGNPAQPWIAGFWIYVDLVLIYTRDAYLVFGIVFLAASCVFFGVIAFRKKKTKASLPKIAN